MLADVRGGTDNLGLADIVILDKDDLEQVSDVFVIVDDISDLVDQVDHSLGHPVARSCFATKNRNSWCQLLALFSVHSFDRKVAVDDAEDVHLLSLVLVYALDLDIEQCCWVHTVAGGFLDMLR